MLMKTFGISSTLQLVDLPATPCGEPDWLAATPPGMFTAQDPRAPWNQDPRAPWNAPDPVLSEDAAPDTPQLEPINRDPSAYPGLLWTPPEVVPLVKLAAPEVISGMVAEPLLVWHSDRVERDWEVRNMTAEELAASTRKIWANSAAFWEVFTSSEKEAIAVSAHPTVRALVITLSTWPSALFSDDPRVTSGLELLQAVGILTAERIAQILA
jgi:hypothetical protein